MPLQPSPSRDAAPIVRRSTTGDSKPFLAAVDCGTTAVKAAIFDLHGGVCGLATRPVPCLRLPDGTVQQDAHLIRSAAFRSLRSAIEQSCVRPDHIAAVCVTNQRATLLCLGLDGEPLAPAIGWQDMRGQQEIAAFRKRIREADYYRITGLPCNAVFTLAKILHLRRHDRVLFRQTCHFALVQDFMLRSFGCRDAVTDQSNASLTGLLDLRSRQWSETVLRLAALDRDRLPALVSPGERVGTVSGRASARSGLLAGTPLIAGAGDQQCAGIGAGVVTTGLCSITLGTAGVCFCHADAPVLDPKRRLMCCVHGVPGKWNIEGLQSSAAGSLWWAARRLAGARGLRPEFLSSIEKVPPGSHGVVFLPYLAGAGAPHWIADATGAFLGLRHVDDVPVMVRAVMEGVAFESRLILDVLDALNVSPNEIRLTGGGTDVPIWNQMQANIYGRQVAMLSQPQATLLGAAMLGAMGAGLFSSLAEAAAKMVQVRDVCRPERDEAQLYARAYARYTGVLKKLGRARIFSALHPMEGTP